MRCLIVDDNARFLVAARTLLEGEEVSIVGVASTGADALRLAAELTPDVVLLDIDLGDESGFDVARQLVRLDAESPRVVLISTYEESDFRELVAESPAIGFVAKAELSRQAIDQLMAS